MKRTLFFFLGACGVACCLPASAEVLDRASGIRIGERMILRPAVSTSFSYDSNVEARSGSSVKGEKDDCIWLISPALSLAYNSETWSLLAAGYYSYRQYFRSCHKNYNQHSYGEDVRWNWSNSIGAERGWSVVLGQSFKQLTMADDFVQDGGINYDGDTRQLQLAGAVQRRFNEHVHGDINADYYWLDYMNDTNNRYSYYGWDRWKVGIEAGYAPSKWTDIILSGNYMGYTQDNLDGSNLSGDSNGFSVQGGLGSYMTDRISYRVLAGWSRFEYADGLSAQNGFVYTATGNWKIGETWNTMLMATSYYQPSERQYASQTRVDAVSWGIAKLLVRGKMRATFDIRYRRESHEYAMDDADWDYVLNIWTGRLGLEYTINRFIMAFASFEYQNSDNSEAEERARAYDYDRWRATLGLRLTY